MPSLASPRRLIASSRCVRQDGIPHPRSPGLASRSGFKGPSADAEDEVKITVLRTVAVRESEADSY